MERGGGQVDEVRESLRLTISIAVAGHRDHNISCDREVTRTGLDCEGFRYRETEVFASINVQRSGTAGAVHIGQEDCDIRSVSSVSSLGTWVMSRVTRVKKKKRLVGQVCCKSRVQEHRW